MREWLAGLAGAQYVDAILWTSAALIALIVVLALIRFFRSLDSGTFVAGGRNRKTRLAVMDATAIDSQRRLVLVRRDDVEHLLLIGGPTDVVVEQQIRLMGQRRAAPVESARPAQDSDEFEADLPPPPPRAPQQARPVPELSPPHGGRPASPPVSQRPVRPPPPAPRSAPDRPPPPEPRMVQPPLRAPVPAPRVQAAPQPMPSVRPAPRPPLPAAPVRRDSTESIEEALMNELDLSSDDLTGGNTSAAPKPKQETSLDDEMARLLGELANPRR